MPSFSHLDPGTPEPVWRDALASRTVRPLEESFDALVVLAAHPDDETLGAGGLLHGAARRGARCVVVVATDGEASHPGSPTHDPSTLARVRREEVRRAVAVLAPEADVVFLGLPDGGLDRAEGRLRERLDAVLAETSMRDARDVVIAAPWRGDGHRDHRLTAEAADAIAARRGCTLLEYPVWAWHWGTPADLPWERLVAVGLDTDDRRAKRRALAAHITQIAPLSERPGDEVLLHAGMLAHFDRAAELFIAPSTNTSPQPTGGTLDARWFDDFYRRNGDDPWGFESRWYEERKRAVLMASLPTAELGDVFEIGCATGMLTRELAGRARSVIAMDAASVAVDRARDRLSGDERATIRCGAVPGDWPEGRFDTIVLSEVGYYLSPTDLQRAIDLMEASLAAGGCIVACHWRHPVAEYPQTGDEVHEALRSVTTWEAIARHEERDFVLEVFARRPGRSVAELEGLV